MVEVAARCVATSHAKFIAQCADALVVDEPAERSLPREVVVLQVDRIPQIFDVHTTKSLKVRPEYLINDGVHKIMHASDIEFGWAC